MTTPMCRNAVLTVMKVMPIASSCWKVRARLLRDPEADQAVGDERERHEEEAEEAPLLADVARR